MLHRSSHCLVESLEGLFCLGVAVLVRMQQFGNLLVIPLDFLRLLALHSADQKFKWAHCELVGEEHLVVQKLLSTLTEPLFSGLSRLLIDSPLSDSQVVLSARLFLTHLVLNFASRLLKELVLLVSQFFETSLFLLLSLTTLLLSLSDFTLIAGVVVDLVLLLEFVLPH